MKKLTAIFLSVIMILSLSACVGSGQQTTSDGSAAQQGSAVQQAEQTNTDTEKRSQILVAYFSATGTTRGVAEQLADGLSADLYEMTPEQAYTSADLNYHDENSRSTQEMNDATARPAISTSVENMDQYDVIFLGYPIWWSDAPRIVDTFLESYDFSGKTIVPFCTSASSGIGSSASNLEKLTHGATWLDGQRFSGSETQETVLAWANSFHFGE